MRFLKFVCPEATRVVEYCGSTMGAHNTWWVENPQTVLLRPKRHEGFYYNNANCYYRFYVSDFLLLDQLFVFPFNMSK